MTKRAQIEKELADTINRHSLENGSNTPDYILAKYLYKCLTVWDAINFDKKAQGQSELPRENCTKYIAAFKDMQLHKVELLPMGDGYVTEWDKGYDEAMSDAIEYLQKQVFPCEK